MYFYQYLWCGGRTCSLPEYSIYLVIYCGLNIDVFVFLSFCIKPVVILESDQNYWIGLQKQSGSFTFRWTNGLHVDYTDWGGTILHPQPDHHTTGTDCVQV